MEKIVYNGIEERRKTEGRKEGHALAKERIGIIGGTFDPIHAGHIAMARAAMQEAGLDRVLVLPTGNPPHKHDISPAVDRWRMVCAATAQEPGLEPCSMELEREGIIYTVDTLAALHEAYPKADLFYIIGADTLFELQNWKDYTRVLGMCTFLVCPRKWDKKPTEIVEERRRLTALGGSFQMVNMDIVDVSSTQVRKALVEGKPMADLPVVCREYAALRGLYGIPAHLRTPEKWLTRLFQDLSVKRFAHTLAVAYTARHLAKIHGVDLRQAEEAAVLHDCAKCLPLKEMQRICIEHQLTDDQAVLESGALMHSIAGAYLAATVYGEEDPDVLRAIACHTTGKVGMTPLDMVVYLADKIEPTRESYPTLEKVRVLAQLSLERAMLCSMEGTKDYVRKGGKPMHPQTLETIAWLKTLKKNGTNEMHS